MESTVVNDKGERVIPGSRRPDGTYRKEVRVKAGYVPQDEQPVYQSRGALVCPTTICLTASPGWDFLWERPLAIWNI